MSQNPVSAAVNLGFLTVVQEASGFAGGYLVTSSWGRPLEFRLSTAVQPNRIHQILYGSTLRSYVCADLIGKALLEKAAVSVQVLFTDHEAVLDLRLRVEIPVVRLMLTEHSSLEATGAQKVTGSMCYHAHYPGDARTVEDLLSRLDLSLVLSEPFVRIREAMTEARRMGVTSRAA